METHYRKQPYSGRQGWWIFMLDTWEGGWGSGNPTMENSPILVDRDSGSSCWTLGREAGIVEIPLWKTAL